MTEQGIRVTIVNHAVVEIGVSPDAVWRAILRDFVEPNRLCEIGAVEPLDDPAAALGGYRLRMEKDGAVVDERIIHITERDETVRRLSLFADYL